jgi:cytidylate kinase
LPREPGAIVPGFRPKERKDFAAVATTQLEIHHPARGRKLAVIITIDGPGGSGKSTVSRILARALDLPYLNSGYIYRTVTLLVLENGGKFEDKEKVAQLVKGMDLHFREDADKTRVFVGDREVTQRLKDPDVTPQVFRIANDGHYRSLLVELQRRFAQPRGVVAEGRDMGSVIFPDADFKFYMDASPEERSRRQHRDLEAAGHSKSYAEVLAEVLERDAHDRYRDVAPLRVPEGAKILHTDSMSPKEVADAVVAHVRKGQGGLARNVR